MPSLFKLWWALSIYVQASTDVNEDGGDHLWFDETGQSNSTDLLSAVDGKDEVISLPNNEGVITAPQSFTGARVKVTRPVINAGQAPRLPVAFQSLPFDFEGSDDNTPRGGLDRGRWPLPMLPQGIEKVSKQDLSALISSKSKGKLISALQRIAADSVMTRNKTTRNTTTTKKSAAADVGVSQNAVGDGTSFLVGLLTNSFAILACSLLFSFFRERYKILYSYRSMVEKPPYEMPAPVSTSFCGWISDSMKMKHAHVAEVSGIDQAMLLYYTELCLKILGTLAIPLCLIEAPLNIFCGGNAAGQDHLSWQGMANVQDDRPYIYWFYALLVWFVVIVTQVYIFGGMSEFMRIRFDWIKLTPAVQAQTIMVENIPEELCTDQDITEYFNKALEGDVVAQARLVKHLPKTTIQTYVDLQREKDQYRLALCQFEKTGMRPQTSTSTGQSDAITHHKEQIAWMERYLVIAAKNIMQYSREADFGTHICCNNGFVTFKTLADTAEALSMRYTADEDVLMVSQAPDPSDVIYAGLMVGENESRIRSLIGYALLFALFMGFLPIILFISGITEITTVEKAIPALKTFIHNAPFFGMLYNSLFGSIAVTLLMSFLPTLLMTIFRCCFPLKSDCEAQHLCQKWYFFFLVVFVLLVTAIGTSLLGTMKKLVKDPTAVFGLLASSLPSSSHYYLNYIVTQWTTHAMGLTRYMNWIKFVIKRQISGDDQYAKDGAEPEDQDYYGIGSRSARFTLIMVIALVFCTLSPLIVLLAIGNFGLCRIIYGYLICYSENPKPEMGGHFFASQMKHTQVGLVLYVILMSGVLYQRAASSWPSAIAAASFVPLVWSMLRFDRRFRWQVLPATLMTDSAQNKKPFEMDPVAYMQPEIAEPRKFEIEGGISALEH